MIGRESSGAVFCYSRAHGTACHAAFSGLVRGRVVANVVSKALSIDSSMSCVVFRGGVLVCRVPVPLEGVPVVLACLCSECWVAFGRSREGPGLDEAAVSLSPFVACAQKHHLCVVVLVVELVLLFAH